MVITMDETDIKQVLEDKKKINFSKYNSYIAVLGAIMVILSFIV